MSEEKKPKRFTLFQPQTSFTLRDLDNGKPVAPHPKLIVIDHPRLAPPGMKGIQPSKFQHTARASNIDVRVFVQITDPNQQAAQPSARPRLSLGQEGETKRAFEPIVKSGPSKGRDFDR